MGLNSEKAPIYFTQGSSQRSYRHVTFCIKSNMAELNVIRTTEGRNFTKLTMHMRFLSHHLFLKKTGSEEVKTSLTSTVLHYTPWQSYGNSFSAKLF